MHPGDHAQTAPDRPAVIMAGSGQVITYAELDEGANRLSQLFRSLGLQPGDHVAISIENHPLSLVMAWGARYAGLIYTFASSRLTREELAYILNDCGARVFISSAHLGDLAESVVADTPTIEARFMVDGTRPGYESYEHAVAAQPSEPLPNRVDGVDMLYSSGTTGVPKGIETPLPGVELGTDTPVAALGKMLFGFDEGKVYLSPAPVYHAAPLRFCLGVHQYGGTVVMMEKFDPETALQLIDRYEVTHSQWVPTMFIRMLKLPEDVRARYDVSSMEAMVHAAAPCPIDVKQRIIEWFGPVVHEYYAGTEGNGFVYCNSEQWLAHPGTVGQSLLGPIHICDEDGEEVPTGEPGTIYFEGAGFAYHNDPEKTAESRHPKGWTTLGDVGYVDEDGFLFLTDRKSYMIISGGVNIYPQEAENVLAMHPAVNDVAVFGVPNDDFGEEVKAVVEPAESATPGPELAAELIAYCRERLADVKCPRTVEELPRQPTGKLYKRLLKDEDWKAAGRTI